MTGTRERSHLPTIPDSCKQRRHFRKDLDPVREELEAGAGGGDPYSAHSRQKEGALPSSFIQKECFQRGHWQWGGKSRHLGSGELQEMARDFF